MHRYLSRAVMAGALVFSASAYAEIRTDVASCQDSALDVEARYLMGGTAQLCAAYAGKVVLVVNTASQCGFAGQLEGLQSLQKRYGERGLQVLGVPSADFGGQEFDEAQRTAEFCKANFGVTFPLLARTPVKGDDAHPLFKRLYGQGAPAPRWNYHKYLLDRDGRLIEDFATRITPDDPRVTAAIEAALMR